MRDLDVKVSMDLRAKEINTFYCKSVMRVEHVWLQYSQKAARVFVHFVSLRILP